MKNSQEIQHAQTYINCIKEDFTKKVNTLQEMQKAIEDIPTVEKLMATLKSQVENDSNKWWKNWPPFSYSAQQHTLNYLLKEVKEQNLSAALEKALQEKKLLLDSDRRIFVVNTITVIFLILLIPVIIFGG